MLRYSDHPIRSSGCEIRGYRLDLYSHRNERLKPPVFRDYCFFWGLIPLHNFVQHARKELPPERRNAMSFLDFYVGGSRLPYQAQSFGTWVTPLSATGLIDFTPALTPRLPELDASLEFDRLIQQWINFLVIENISKSTLPTYKSYLSKFWARVRASGVQIQSVAQLFDRASLIAGFQSFDQEQYSLKRSTKYVLHKFATYLVDEGLLNEEAAIEVLKINFRKKPETRRTVLGSDDIPDFVRSLETRSTNPHENITFSAIVFTMMHTGLRVTEACNLDLADVSLSNQEITVRYTKGGETRTVGINQKLLEVLIAYYRIRSEVIQISKTKDPGRFFVCWDGAPWNKDKIGRRMRHVSELIGKNITPHGLRATFATLAAESGKPAVFIRDALGHKHLSTTEIYLRTSERRMVEAMKEW